MRAVLLKDVLSMRCGGKKKYSKIFRRDLALLLPHHAVVSTSSSRLQKEFQKEPPA